MLRLIKNNRPIFVFHSPDEMRHPYEAALKKLGGELTWFTSFPELIAKNSDSPEIVIIDLDALARPWEDKVEEIRKYFSNSDLIALSSLDSAQTVLMCLRSGFADSLLKPLSPEELAWSVKKTHQRLDTVKKLDGPKTTIVRAITQISGCTTPTLVRLCALEYILGLFKAEGGAWLKTNGDTLEVSCFAPQKKTPQEILSLLPDKQKWKNGVPPKSIYSTKTNTYKIYLSGTDAGQGLFLWGVREKPKARTLLAADTVMEHAEVSVLTIRKYDEVKQQTFIDDLTGLYNSRYLKFALATAIARCKKETDHFAVLFTDVDHFKSINDQNGHVVGSNFLVAIGKTVRNAVRNIDPVFRYGGDEFVVILHDTSVEGAKEIAERIRKNIERRVFVLQGHRLQTTVSVGIAVYPDHASKHETLLKLADEAMYTAKKESRNAVHMAYGVEKEAKPRRTGSL